MIFSALIFKIYLFKKYVRLQHIFYVKIDSANSFHFFRNQSFNYLINVHKINNRKTIFR